MARDKEKTVNPATAALKSQKHAQIKKQKAAVAAQRTERLAHRNPDRLQRQIDDLLALKESSGGKLKPRDEQTLHGLERDVRLIHKARGRDDRSGSTNANNLSQRDGRNGNTHDEKTQSSLGKRSRGSDHARHDRARRSDSEDTDPEVRNIPMPRDTPPPIPRRRGGPDKSQAQPAKPVIEAKKSYSAAPQMRDLQKEAVSKFVPAAVAARARAKAGPQPMLEPDEADALEEAERQGKQQQRLRQDARRAAAGAADAAAAEAEHEALADSARGTVADDEANVEARLRQVEYETAAEQQQHGARRDLLVDAERAADEAEAEAVHETMADAARSDATGREDQAMERRLHQVEIEEVEDADMPAGPGRLAQHTAVPVPAPQPQPPAQEEASEDGSDVFSW